MTPCEITSPELPAATFVGCAALRRHAAERKEYEIAVRTFEQDRDTESLTETLAALGYDADEIAAHVTTPGYRFPERFI